MLCITLGSFLTLSSQLAVSENNEKAYALPDSSALNKISDFIESEVGKGFFIGAELYIARENTPLYHKAYGLRDIEDSIPMVNNTIFNIRSMTKTFIGAAIHILIDQDKISYETKVSDLLPGFNNDKSKEITIRHLLTHSSGLPLSIYSSGAEYSCLLDVANKAGETGPVYKPGYKFQYSDTGADVLGAIIEVVSGNTLYEFLQNKLFVPLKMENTYPISKVTDFRNDMVASSYGGSPGKWEKFWSYRDDPFYNFPMGSQSYYCSAKDYSKFMSMLLNKGKAGNASLLSRQSVRNILSPDRIFRIPATETEYQSGFPAYTVYHGLMSMLYCKNDKDGAKNIEIVGYGGSDGTFAWAWPKSRLIVILFTQSRNFSNFFQFYDFENILYQSLMNPDRGDSPEVSSPSLLSYPGKYRTTYESNENAVFEIVESKDGLGIIIPNQPMFELKPPDKSGLWHFKASNMLSVSFNYDDNKNVTGFTLLQKTGFIKKDEPDSELQGIYHQPYMNLNIVVEEVGEHLEIQIGEGGRVRLNKNKKGIWIFPDNKKHLEFVHDEDGAIVSLNIIDLLEAYKGTASRQT